MGCEKMFNHFFTASFLLLKIYPARREARNSLGVMW